MNKAVVITGGAGFLAYHLAHLHLGVGDHVIAIDNFATGMRENVERLTRAHRESVSFHFLEWDVCQPWGHFVQEVVESHKLQVTHVYHLASPASPPHYQRLAFETIAVNTLGLQNALAVADGHCARVVFASTSEIYGDPEFTPQPEAYRGNVNTCGPRACYDEAKRLGETIVYTHNWKFKKQHGMVRIFNTYGPYMNPDDGRVVVNFIQQAAQGLPLTVYGDGSQTRSFCFVDDLVKAIYSYGQNSNLTFPINIGNEKEFTVKELAEAVLRLFPSTRSKIVYEPLPEDDPKRRRPDLSLARQHLSSWSPMVDLEEGLIHMRNWVLNGG